jgi:asparagine synthetase A
MHHGFSPGLSRKIKIKVLHNTALHVVKDLLLCERAALERRELNCSEGIFSISLCRNYAKILLILK